MKKLLLLIPLALLSIFLTSDPARPQTSEYRTITLAGTNDVLIDSSMTTTYMSGRRMYINGIYAWYANAANTNRVFIEIVRGQSAMASPGVRRVFKYSEAMTSGGIKGIVFQPINLTTDADSTIYFLISGASSDSLNLMVNFKLVN